MVYFWEGGSFFVPRQKEGGAYRILDEDEPALLGVVRDGEADVFPGYALQEVERVAQQKMFGDVWSACNV